MEFSFFFHRTPSVMLQETGIMMVTWTGFLLPCGRTKANAPCLAVRSLPVEIRYIVTLEEGSLKTLQIRQVKVVT